MPKRDLDRIREILLHVENETSKDGWVGIRDRVFFRDDDAYQIDLMKQAGFVDADSHAISRILPGRVRISFAGHDYLDAVRDEGIWAQTKEAVKETGGSATIEIAKTLALGFLKKKISQHTGIEL